jgi:hypothetical protein
MRKHIIPFYLEAPTQVVNATGAQAWNGRSSKISITDGTDNVTLSVDAVASEGLIKPGALLVVEWNVASITSSKKVTINYKGSAISELDAAGESVTFLFFDDRDSVDDPAWEVIAKDASTGNLSAVDIALSGDLAIDTNLFVVDSANDKIGFFGATAVVQQTGAAALTDSTGGTAAANNTLVAVTDTTSDVSGLINNNFATLAREVEVLRAKLAAYGLLG